MNAVLIAGLSDDLVGDRPLDATASDAAWLFTVVVGLGFLFVAGICVAHAIRHRDTLPLLMLASGLIAVGLEPVVDTLGKVWYASDNPLVVYTAMGVPQPAFLLLGYSLFWGGTVYVGFRFVQQGTSVWKVFGVVFVMDLFVEYLGATVLGVGVYYGYSPFRLFEFPLWWAFVNAAAPAIGIAILYVLTPHMRGWNKLTLLAVSPAAFGGAHGICAWPTWVAINSSVPHWAVWVAGSMTIAMSLLTVHIVARALSPDSFTAATSGRATVGPH